MKKFLFLVALSFIFSGCEYQKSINEKAIDACLDKGGVPLLSDSFWTPHALLDCKFK